MNNNESSGVNTILIVVVLVAVVGFMVWYFGVRGTAPAQDTDRDIQVDVELPGGNGGEGDNGGNQGGGQ